MDVPQFLIICLLVGMLDCFSFFTIVNNAWKKISGYFQMIFENGFPEIGLLSQWVWIILKGLTIYYQIAFQND